MKKSLRIVFFGNEKIATGVDSQPIVFEALIESGYDIAALVVHSSEMTSRKTKSEPIVELAKQNNIPVLNPHKLADEIETIRNFNADIGVLVAYGKIIPKDIIDIFPKGIINVHPSMLPNLRGSTPVESVIIQGLTSTGVSIMQLAPEMDSGPVFAQKKVSISSDISKQELASQLHNIGKDMIIKVLDGIDDLEPEAQDNTKATFCSLISKEDGKLDWTKPAEQLEREVRAYSGWPKSSCSLFGIDLVVHEAHVSAGWGSAPGTISVDFSTKQLKVQCLRSSLELYAIQPAGKKPMDIPGFLNGYRHVVLNSEATEIH